MKFFGQIASILFGSFPPPSRRGPLPAEEIAAQPGQSADPVDLIETRLVGPKKAAQLKAERRAAKRAENIRRATEGNYKR